MELYTIAGLLVAGVALVGYAIFGGRDKDHGKVMRRMAGRSKDTEEAKADAGGAQAAKNIMTKVAPMAMKPVMPRSDEQMSMLRVRLANAGFRDESASSIFLASKTILALIFGIGTAMLALNRGAQGMTVFGLAAIVGTVGFVLPEAWLWLARRKRAEAIRNGLPDSLDLMVISVEAGLGLDAAIQRVSDEMASVHPTLSQELSLANLETQMGLPRAEALANLANRTGVAEMRSLVAVVTQAERFGTSIARALRNQADALRIKRRQAAEERAQKTTVKLMLPLILFIFPAIFVVLGGPAALKFIEAFHESGMMG
jgi:tight adherence protein C